MGFLLKVSGKYVCWNSYTAKWCLGPKKLSEVFSYEFHSMKPGRLGNLAWDHFPTAKLVWVKPD